MGSGHGVLQMAGLNAELEEWCSLKQDHGWLHCRLSFSHVCKGSQIGQTPPSKEVHGPSACWGSIPLTIFIWLFPPSFNTHHFLLLRQCMVQQYRQCTVCLLYDYWAVVWLHKKATSRYDIIDRTDLSGMFTKIEPIYNDSLDLIFFHHMYIYRSWLHRTMINSAI